MGIDIVIRSSHIFPRRYTRPFSQRMAYGRGLVGRAYFTRDAFAKLVEEVEEVMIEGDRWVAELLLIPNNARGFDRPLCVYLSHTIGGPEPIEQAILSLGEAILDEDPAALDNEYAHADHVHTLWVA